LIILGDPMTRPWAKIPVVEVDGLIPNQTYKGKIQFQAKVSAMESRPIHHYELFVAGRRYAACFPGEKFDLETSYLPDGKYLVKLVAVVNDPVQTNGQLIVPIYLQNHGQEIQILACPTTICYNEMLNLEIAMRDATEILVLHNARRLASVSGPVAKVQIPGKTLGLGKITLEILGITAAQSSAIAQISVEILPPPVLAASSARIYGKPIPGLLLTFEGQQKIIQSTLAKNWLLESGVQSEQSFVLQGYFDVPSKTIAQFQLRGIGAIQLICDSTTVLDIEKSEGWQYIPLFLDRGSHSFTIKAKVFGPELDIRFGSVGTASLDQSLFYHFEP